MKKRNLFVVFTLLICCAALFSGCANGLVSELLGEVIHEHPPILSTPPMDIVQFSAQSMQVSMDYGMHRSGLATPLLNSCTTEFLDKDVWDLDVFVPGDIYHLTYMGELMVQETYPGTVILPEGGFLDVTRVDAGILCLEYDGGWKPVENGYQISGELCEYVILDEQGSFCSLADYDTTKALYVTYYRNLLQPGKAITPLAAYAYAPRETQQTAFQTSYDYGVIRENKATLLMDSATVFVDVPLIAGDEVYVSFTGECLTQESYPANVVFVDGEVKRVDVRNARICVLTVIEDAATGKKMLMGESNFAVQSVPDYVLTNSDGSFTALNDFPEGAKLYASYSADQGVFPTSIAGLYTYLPRN